MLLEMRCVMSISKYQVFLKTVSCGSFSKAAEAMNFTQSGISHAINSLENELGVKLLSRNRGGVVLTADGRAVLPKIEKLCAAHHSLMQTVEGLKDRPDARNLVNIYAGLSGQPVAGVVAEFAGAQFGTFKPKLAELAVAKLAPITTEMNRLMKDPAEIDRILGDGADRADVIAAPILARTKEIVGMIGRG